jgi:hypothetical protein
MLSVYLIKKDAGKITHLPSPFQNFMNLNQVVGHYKVGLLIYTQQYVPWTAVFMCEYLFYPNVMRLTGKPWID